MQAVDENRIEPSIYRYVLQYTKRDQILILLLTLATMPVVYGSLEVPKVIVNSALSGENIPGELFGFEITQISYLLILCGIFLALVLVAGGLKYVTNVYRGIVGERMLRRIRFDLYSRLLRFPTPRFKQVSQAEILPMVTAETEPLGGFIGDAFALPAFQGGLLFTYLFFIFNQDVVLGLAAIALYPPQLYVIPKLQKKVNDLAKRRVQAVRHLSDKVGESISGIADIHVNDTSRYEKAHISSRLGLINKIRIEIYQRKFFIKFLNNFLGQLTPFFFYAIGGYFVIKGELSLGALVAVLAAYKDLASPWRELLKFYQITEDVRVKYRQIIEQFQPKGMLSPKLQQDQEIAVDFSRLPIHANRVSYSEDEYVKSLDAISLQVGEGKHIAILGHGGSGRADLTKLIARLIHPDQGTIKFGDEDIAILSESVLGRRTSYVDQTSYVFNGSILDNLVYGIKNCPTAQAGYADENQAENTRFVRDAAASGNSIDDINADWMNLDSAGAGSKAEFAPVLFDILNATELTDDIYQFGMNSVIDYQAFPELTAPLLSLRKRMAKVLADPSHEGLVEKLQNDVYNANLSLAENLFFGAPKNLDPEYSQLLEHETVRQVISESGLEQTILDIGLKTARTLSEIFADVPDSSPLFERFSFVTVDELPLLHHLAAQPEVVEIASLDNAQQTFLKGIAMKLTAARHRLGLLTEEIQSEIISAHHKIRQTIGDDNELIEFFHNDRLASQLTVQDNILFGRIAHGQNNARERLGKLMDEVIEEAGLQPDILEIGLEYPVGVAGGRLNSTQRQKLTLARALVKNPEILIVNEATSLFDKRTAEHILKKIIGRMSGKSVLWVLNNAEFIALFESVIVLEKGQILFQDSVEAFKMREDLVSANS